MTVPDLPLFSAQWCDQAAKLYVTDVAPFIRDPENFTYTAEFAVLGGAASQFSVEKNRMTWWKPGSDHLAEPGDFVLHAREEHWAKVIGGQLEPVPAIAAKRIHLVRGPMDVVIKETDALKRMILSWAKIGTPSTVGG